MKSIIIFLIWFALLILGVLTKAKKKTQDQTVNTTPIEKEAADNVITSEAPKADTPKPQAAPMAEEGIATTEPVKTTPQPAPAPKGREMDFDPVEMVIYSEVMEPGYEKY